jgi:23S rRNA pseudouridine1911/1915/1917 synthase
VNDDTLSVEVADSLQGERVDRAVALLLEVSRAVASELIGDGAVSLDGRTVTKPSVRLESGQLLRVPGSVAVPALQADASVILHPVYVDDDVLVLEKIAGLVVHPGAGVESGTLVQGVLAAYPDVATVGEPERPGIVHRLDRGTSGLLMVARSAVAFVSLTEQLRERRVEREYLGLVHGLPGANEGVIDAPIGRSLRHPTRQSVRPDGKRARTYYAVVE